MAELGTPGAESPEELAAELETAAHDLTATQRRRVLFAAGVGNVLEWYDWTIYAAFSVYFASQIFGGSSEARAAIWAAVVFALGFVARPAGGIILGRIADQKSRSFAMFLSISIMCFGSLGIALAPTAAQIGIWAGIWLLFVRMLQGASLGGELPSAVAYLVDYTTPGRRARFVGWFACTLVIGTFIGSTVGVVLTLMLTDEQMNVWGWRIPFLLGAVMAVFGLWLRKRAPHTPMPTTDPNDKPLRTLLTKYRPTILRCMAIAAGDALGFYGMATIFPQMAQSHGASENTTFLANMIGLAIMAGVVMGWARLADRYGLERMLSIALLTQALVMIPALFMINGGFLNTLVLQIIVLVPIGMILGCDMLYVADQFPKKYRALGLAVAYTVAVTIFGGTAELLWDVVLNNNVTYLFPLYISAVSCVGAAFVFRHIRSTRSRELVLGRLGQ